MILRQVPSSNYGPNTRAFETPDPLDPSFTRMRITVTRENWPGSANEVVGSIQLEVAEDGVNYPPISGASINLIGGPWMQRDGVTPVATQSVECSLPGVGLATRKVRATFINTQQLRTAITVEAF